MIRFITPWGRAGFMINKIPRRYKLIRESSIVHIEGIKNYIFQNMGDLPTFETILTSSENRVLDKASEFSEVVQNAIPADDISDSKESMITCKDEIVSETYGLETLKDDISAKNEKNLPKIEDFQTTVTENIEAIKEPLLNSLQAALEERGYYDNGDE